MQVRILRALSARGTLCAGQASLRTLCNACLAIRRLLYWAQHCLLGCLTLGGDDSHHYLACPVVHAAAAQHASRPVAWAVDGADPFRVFTLVDVPLPEDEEVLRV